jgi:hypothetical protein
MSSVTRFTAQIPLGASHLVALNTAGDFIWEEVVNALAVGTGGVVSISGSVVTFNTLAQVATALGDSAGDAFVQNEFFEDLGKNLYVYFLNNGVATRALILTKVRRILTAATSDGANGNIGYVATWSASPTGSSGGTVITVAVARTSYQNGGI